MYLGPAKKLQKHILVFSFVKNQHIRFNLSGSNRSNKITAVILIEITRSKV